MWLDDMLIGVAVCGYVVCPHTPTLDSLYRHTGVLCKCAPSGGNYLHTLHVVKQGSHYIEGS